MTRSEPDFITLNAYVDGELDPADAAAVADAAAHDPGIAEELAKLHAMKAAVRETFESPTVIAVYPSRHRFAAQLRWASAAAVLAVMLVGAGLWLGLPYVAQPSQSEGIVLQALDDHDRWLGHPGKIMPVADAAGFLLPDLGLAGLSIARIDTMVKLNGLPATQIGYLGQSGCHLSLFILQGGGKLDLASVTGDKTILADSWKIGGALYLTIARHMNPVRFATLSQALRLATRNGTPLDERLRTALANAHQPCVS